MTAVPKPRKRVRDPKASRRKLNEDRWCRAHRQFGVFVLASNTHHLLGKGQSGDDVESNLIPLCGHGCAGCHGALHGNPYQDALRGRVTAQDVRQAIGLRLRPVEVEYVVERLGEAAGLEHLRRFYFVDAHLEPFLQLVPVSDSLRA